MWSKSRIYNPPQPSAFKLLRTGTRFYGLASADNFRFFGSTSADFLCSCDLSQSAHFHFCGASIAPADAHMRNKPHTCGHPAPAKVLFFDHRAASACSHLRPFPRRCDCTRFEATSSGPCPKPNLICTRGPLGPHLITLMHPTS